jgi:hypothetical protein
MTIDALGRIAWQTSAADVDVHTVEAASPDPP